MSVGANTTSATKRDRKAGLVAICLLLCVTEAPYPAHAAGLVASVLRVSTLQTTPQELAGPARPTRQHTTAARPPAPPPPPPEPTQDAYVSSLVPAISFPAGSAQLTPSATRILDNLGHSLTAPGLAADRFRVEGHTDTTGSPVANRDLASRRAQAVVAYLEQNCGIPASRLEAVASTKPLAPTGEGVALALNRRIRLVNLGP
jgi:outer membrane protein OmpA-like peptidoglycan-associated protein